MLQLLLLLVQLLVAPCQELGLDGEHHISILFIFFSFCELLGRRTSTIGFSVKKVWTAPHIIKRGPLRSRFVTNLVFRQCGRDTRSTNSTQLRHKTVNSTQLRHKTDTIMSKSSYHRKTRMAQKKTHSAMFQGTRKFIKKTLQIPQTHIQ